MHRLRSSSDSMFLWISLNSYPNLLLVRSHQAELIIVKRLIQGRNNVTRVEVEVEPRPCDKGRRKNDAFTLLITLQNITSIGVLSVFYLTSYDKMFQIRMNVITISTTAMKRLQLALILTVHFFVNAMWVTSIVPRLLRYRQEPFANQCSMNAISEPLRLAMLSLLALTMTTHVCRTIYFFSF